MSAQLLIMKPLASLAQRNPHNDREWCFKRLGIGIVFKHAKSLFCLILFFTYHLYRDGSSWVEPVLS